MGGMRSVTFRLPSGLGVHAADLARHARVTLDGRSVRSTFSYRNGRLTITFAKAGHVAIITIASPALTVSRSSAGKVRSHHAGKLTLLTTVRNANGRNSTLRLSSSAQ
jgi:hypothetical protein